MSETNISINPTVVPLRNEIDEKYKWDLTHLYSSEDKWESDFKLLENSIPKYSEFQGELSKSAANLLSFFKFDEEVGIRFNILHHYAFMKKDEDLTQSKYQSMYERSSVLASRLSSAASFVNPELLSLPDGKIEEFINSEPELKTYEHYFERLLKKKNHIRNAEIEELLAEASRIESASYDAFGFFNNADIPFPEVLDTNGKPVILTHGRYSSALFEPDRDYRERVYKNFYKPYIQFKNTLAALFNSNIKVSMFEAKARKYPNTLDAALSSNNIPVAVYDNLIATVNENLQPLHRWAEIKRKALGLDSIHPFDSYVSLFNAANRKYSFEEGKKLVYEALFPLGSEYLSLLKTAFNNRWIDVHETKGKRSGAYSSGSIFSKHPYVLLNWSGTLNDVFTLAHEMGHNMHSYLTATTQPFIYADYTIFVAEVASTVNEALLLDYLIQNSGDVSEKLYLMEKYLLNCVTTFYRQTRFAEFEKLTHSLTESGEALNSDRLCELYGNLYAKYWGDAMYVDEEEKYTWARVPHFYYNFYVYQYATGFSAAEALSGRILNDGQSAVDDYLNFLKSGNSNYSIELLKSAGVDMLTPDPVLAVIRRMDSMLDNIENHI